MIGVQGLFVAAGGLRFVGLQPAGASRSVGDTEAVLVGL